MSAESGRERERERGGERKRGGVKAKDDEESETIGKTGDILGWTESSV